MTPIDQNIAIAKACGWTGVKRVEVTGTDLSTGAQTVWNDVRGTHHSFPGYLYVPSYLKDLNLIHRAEKMLTEERRTLYQDILYGIASGDTMLDDDWKLVTATAAQRCEAFLRTLNLWEDA